MENEHIFNALKELKEDLAGIKEQQNKTAIQLAELNQSVRFYNRIGQAAAGLIATIVAGVTINYFKSGQ